MSTRSTLLATAMPFAHLLGRTSKPASVRAAEPDDKRDDETQEEYEERKRREQDDDEQARARSARKGRAADKPADQGDDESDEDYEERKRREQDDSAHRADDDSGDDDDLEMSDDEEDEEDTADRKDSKAMAARKRERARCRAIFASKHAEGRVELAAHLAFDTKIGRRQAVKLLQAAPKAGAATSLVARMAGMEALRPGQDGAGAPDKRRASNDSWDAAAKRVGIRRS